MMCLAHDFPENARNWEPFHDFAAGGKDRLLLVPVSIKTQATESGVIFWAPNACNTFSYLMNFLICTHELLRSRKSAKGLAKRLAKGVLYP
jgi:hypothetical protein